MHGEVTVKKSTLQQYNGFPLVEGIKDFFFNFSQVFVALLREIYNEKKRSNTTRTGKETQTDLRLKAAYVYGGNFVGVLLILLAYQLLIGLPFVGDTKILESYFKNLMHSQDEASHQLELEKQLSQLEEDMKPEIKTQHKRAVDDLQ